MRMTKNSILAFILIGLGVLFLFNGLGPGIGKLMGFIIPIAMIFLGYLGIKQGKSLLGWSLLIIGAIILLGKFAGLFGLLISIGLIIVGISLLKKGKNAY